MTDRTVALPGPRAGRAPTFLRIRRTLAVVVALAALLVGADYAAAALTEAAVSKQMRTQLNLVDDPAVRINNFPFLVQAISGRYRSVDVFANHLAIGPLRDVQARVQLRNVRAPLSELLAGSRTVTVQEAEGTVRIGAPDVERLLDARMQDAGGQLSVDKVYIDGIDAAGLEKAVEDGSDPTLLALDPATAARFGGTLNVLGEEQPVSVIAELQLAAGRAQIVPRDIRVGDPDADPLPAPLLRGLRSQFTLNLDPGDLPLEVTPTRLRATSGGLEVSGLTGRRVIGGGTPPS